jgi:hypothetical protein
LFFPGLQLTKKIIRDISSFIPGSKALKPSTFFLVHQSTLKNKHAKRKEKDIG